MTTTNTAARTPITTHGQADDFRTEVLATRDSKGRLAAQMLLEAQALVDFQNRGVPVSWIAPLSVGSGFCFEAETEADLDRAIEWFAGHGLTLEHRAFDKDCGWAATVVR